MINKTADIHMGKGIAYFTIIFERKFSNNIEEVT